MNEALILDNDKIQKIVKRIAYELFEQFIHENELIMVGIKENGYSFAKILASELDKLSTQNNKVTLCSISINKEIPLKEDITLSINPNLLLHKNVILVDDVLNSGNTLMHAASFIMKSDVRLIKTVVLVDRKHRKFPIRADHVGLTLSTTLQEHIEVSFTGDNIQAHLI